MLNILRKILEIRKYYTQAGNVINILSREHQHNVNSLAFLSLFGYTLIEGGELGLAQNQYKSKISYTATTTLHV